MRAKESISLLFRAGLGSGEARPVWNADAPVSTGLPGRFAAACGSRGSGAEATEGGAGTWRSAAVEAGLAVTRSLRLHLGPASVMTVLLTVTVASVARLPVGEVMVDLSAHGLMPR
jgi:hypothetical protein